MDRLVARMDAMGTPACVGLDPVFERLPDACTEGSEVEAIERFSLGVIEAVAGVVPVVKPQSACFERYGSAGWAALELVVNAAREAGLFVMLDAKRGDISTSAQHYARSAARLGADAVTVSPYLGMSAVEPFLESGLVVFALCRTSNPDSNVIQAERLACGDTVAEHVATMLNELGSRWMGERGISAVGAVVGATKAEECASLRKRMPDTMFLAPGIGAQGASAADIAPLSRSDRSSIGSAGLMPSASRSVIYPGIDSANDGSWTQSITDAASAFAQDAKAAALG